MNVFRKCGVWLALCELIALTGQVHGHGAFAMGRNQIETATSGVAVGAAVNAATIKAAAATALQKCRTEPSSPAESKARCKLVTTFRHQWLSIAIDPAPRAPGFGWSIDPNKANAERNALNQCKVSSIDERQRYCVIGVSKHDVSP
jgi:hypothetical protein